LLIIEEAMFQAGQKFGQYTLVGKLARGGFGEVWLAEKQSPLITRRVAVKLPRDGEFDFEAVRRETELWEQANGHPNVLPLIDADVYNGQVFIVSEYIEGGSLADRLRKDGKLPVLEAVRIVIGVLNGLEYLHSKNIIHRDIKPANILMQDGATPRLADFGLSRAVETSALVSSNIVGTQPYMSPESFEGVRSVQTDIWSVGVLLYHLLTGRVPFQLGQPSEIMYAVLTKDPALLPEEIPPRLRQIIYKALEKDRELNGSPPRRYQTAAAMRADLEAFLEQFSSLQPPQQQVATSTAFETVKVAPQMPSMELATRMRVPVKSNSFWQNLTRQKFTPVVFLALILGVGAAAMLFSLLLSGRPTSAPNGIVDDTTLAANSTNKALAESNSTPNQPIDDAAILASKEFYRKGDDFFTRRKYDKAIENYTLAIELNPNEFGLYNNRGAALYATGEFRKAIADYTKALELNPYHFSAYNNRGVAYENVGEIEQALADYRKALELDPENKLAKSNLKRILK
jgi:serine/threonine protein kinase